MRVLSFRSSDYVSILDLQGAGLITPEQAKALLEKATIQKQPDIIDDKAFIEIARDSGQNRGDYDCAEEC